MRRLLIALVALSNLFIPSAAQEVPMDYSFCGYRRSELPIPSVNNAVYVQPKVGDNSQQIQAAIDFVSQQKPDKKTGFRGAVLLAEGRYDISEPLRIRTNGVVLRGSGREKTVIHKTGYDRGAAIYIEGTREIITKDTLAIADVQPGALSIRVQSGSPA